MQYIAHKKLAGPITASLHPSNIEMSQQYKATGNAVFDLTRLIYISDLHSRDECIIT